MKRLEVKPAGTDRRRVVDPYVTTIVGRNDIGKTVLLDHFFNSASTRNHFRRRPPMVPGYQGNRTAYSTIWGMTPEDFDLIPVPGGIWNSRC
jgi:hypothetical protein